MTSKEYIEQQIAAGYDIHLNYGVWWQKRAPFFYRPVNFLQQIVPGEAKPRTLKSFLGYSHLVNEAQYANDCWPVMILTYDRLKAFSLENIPASKRKRIRKGLRLTQVKRITNIIEVIDDIQKICISMAHRTRHGLPPEYYINNYQKWKSFMINEFNLANREWWGTYYDGRLVAYRYNVLIDNTMFFLATKSHSDHLDKCPNDALMFTFIDYCRNLETCQELNAGDYNNSRPTINEFKERFGFKRVDMPMYKKYHPLVILAKKMDQFRRKKKW